jgi:hypothetical protein
VGRFEREAAIEREKGNKMGREKRTTYDEDSRFLLHPALNSVVENIRFRRVDVSDAGTL